MVTTNLSNNQIISNSVNQTISNVANAEATIELSNNSFLNSSSRKWVLSFIAGILFALISSPVVYELINSISLALKGPLVFLPVGPTWFGILINSIIFLLLFRLILA